jgi:hypothetical protein
MYGKEQSRRVPSLVSPPASPRRALKSCFLFSLCYKSQRLTKLIYCAVQRAKPGNPGYGFRRARWRDTLENEADRHRCEAVLKEAGLEKNRVETILVCVQQVCTHALFAHNFAR